MADRYPTFAEQRRTRRLRLQLETLRRTGERTLHDKLYDLSSSGFSLLSGSPIAPKEQIEIKLIASDHGFDIPVRAEVVHVRPSRHPGLKRVGLRFVGEAPVRKLLLSSLHVLSQSRNPPRLEVGVDAVWSGPGGSTTGALYLANLGLDGALVHGVGLPGVGGPLIVGIYPPESEEMVALPARVIWSNPAGEGTVAGLGFALETYTRAAVASYLESLLFTPHPLPTVNFDCPPGTRIGGFVVGPLLERGRTHAIFKAQALKPEVDSQGAPEVALRRFTGSPRDVDLWSDRFLDAMLIGTELDPQPEVLKVFGATRERDAAWLATELFPSTSFDRIIAQQDRSAPVPVEGLVAVVEQALVGLAAAHTRAEGPGGSAIVHTDLRPSTILVGDAGEVKLTGFGSAPAQVVPGDVRVPPDRMPWLPPELFKSGGPITPAADVFQMGAVLYEALTGASPFDAQNPAELEKQALAGAVPPSQLNPLVTPELDAAVLAALSADPHLRPQTAAAFLEVLRPPPLAEPASPLPAPLPELLQKVVTRSGSHAAFTPEQRPEDLAAKARAHLESDQRLQVRKQGLAAGEMLGRYEILENIARGGMAEVYRARVTAADGTEQVVVLKTIFQEDATDVGNVKLFLNEARVAALLIHPNIVQLTDYGFDRGRPFIAMEYVHGVTLAELIAVLANQGQRVPPALAARLISDAAAGLAYAHAVRDAEGRTLDLVHRDVSARNILIGFDGSVKLLDFGIAKFRGSSETTASGRVRGTSAYLAPEQIREEAVTGAVDIWALGVNLYRLLTGILPFERDTLALSIASVLQHHPPPAHDVDASAPPELSAIAERALKKAPGERYPWAGQLRSDLEKFIAGKPGTTADLKAMLDGLFPPTGSGRRRPATADLTALKKELEDQSTGGPQSKLRATAPSEPLPSPFPLGSHLAPPPVPSLVPLHLPDLGPPAVAQPAEPLPAPLAPSPVPPPLPRSIARQMSPVAPPPLPQPGASPGAPPPLPTLPRPISPQRAAAALSQRAPVPSAPPLPPVAAGAADGPDDLDIAVTEEPPEEVWDDAPRERGAEPPALAGLDAEETTAVRQQDARAMFEDEPKTTEINLDQLKGRKAAAKRGPLGLVARPSAPPAKKPPSSEPAFERFTNDLPPVPEFEDLFREEAGLGLPGSALPTNLDAPPPDTSTSAAGQVADPFIAGLTTEPVPAAALEPTRSAPEAQADPASHFATRATEQVAAYQPPAPPEAVPLATQPAIALADFQPPAPAVAAGPSTALEWMRLWCEQPDAFLVIPGEAPVPRIWVARLMLDGYLAGKPHDTSWAAFDAWARARVSAPEGRWVGEALLTADPERDHLNAIAALLSLIREHAGGR